MPENKAQRTYGLAVLDKLHPRGTTERRMTEKEAHVFAESQRLGHEIRMEAARELSSPPRYYHFMRYAPRPRS